MVHGHEIPSLELTWHLPESHPKRKVVFQPSIFRCELLVSGTVPPFSPSNPRQPSLVQEGLLANSAHGRIAEVEPFREKKPLSIFRLLHPYPKGCIKYDYTSHTKSDSTPHEMPKFINHETDDSTGIFSSNSSIFELHSISWFFENSGPSYSPVYPKKTTHTHRIHILRIQTRLLGSRTASNRTKSIHCIGDGAKER